MSKWVLTRLGDVVSINTTTYSSKYEWQYVNYLDTGNITENVIDNIQLIKIAKDKLPSRARRVVKHNSIIYSTVRPNQRHYGIIKNMLNNFLVSTGFVVIDVDENKADADFIYFLLSQDSIVEKLHAIAEQSVSTYPSIKASDMENLEIKIPPIAIQKGIARLLRSIDEKIANNTSINKNLERQVKAIFKKWFIDNPQSENWENRTFSFLIENTINGDWGKEAAAGNNTEMVYCIRGADIQDVRLGNKGKLPTRFILPKNYTAKKLVPGDIVVEISGGSPTQSTGRATVVSQALLDRYDKGMICTNFCKAIKPKVGYSMFVYHYWQYLYDIDKFFSYENGTTGIKNLDISGVINNEPISIAPRELIDKFEVFCDSVYKEIYANAIESEYLVSLRDAILPKLMSGEIDVSNLNI